MRAIVIILWLSPLLGFSQQNFLVAETGYASYQMSDMKSFQSELISSTHLPLRALESFPGYFNYAFTFGRQVGRNVFGLSLGYNATGGRADYEDYSGMARIDQQLKSYSLRVMVRDQINKSNKWPLFASVSVSWIRTNLDIDTEFALGTATQSASNGFYSNNFGVIPSFVLIRNLPGKLFIQASAGYELQLAGKLYSSSDHTSFLTHPGGNEVKADWTGFRFSLGLGIYPWRGKVSDQSKPEK